MQLFLSVWIGNAIPLTVKPGSQGLSWEWAFLYISGFRQRSLTKCAELARLSTGHRAQGLQLKESIQYGSDLFFPVTTRIPFPILIGETEPGAYLETIRKGQNNSRLWLIDLGSGFQTSLFKLVPWWASCWGWRKSEEIGGQCFSDLTTLI